LLVLAQSGSDAAVQHQIAETKLRFKPLEEYVVVDRVKRSAHVKETL